MNKRRSRRNKKLHSNFKRRKGKNKHDVTRKDN